MIAHADLLIIGNGMATGRLLQRLTESGYPGAISVIGDEPHPAYNRILLSSVLAGDKDYPDLFTLSHNWYAQHGIRLFSGERAIRIQTDTRRVICASGLNLSYSTLVMATGSRASRPGLPGEHLSGVMAFRAIADSQAMQRAAVLGGQAVVLGGGLLGLEAAAGLRHLGMEVTVLQRNALLMNRQLDSLAATWLRDALEARGIRVQTSAQIAAIEGRTVLEAVHLESGERLPARLLVIAAGITPNDELAQAAGLHCEQGILVDDLLQSSTPGIYALGECSRHRGQHYGLVAPIWEQVDVLSAQLTGNTRAQYHGSDVATLLKVDGIPLFSAGCIDAQPQQQVLIWHDPVQRHYRKLILQDHHLVGAVLFGEQQDGHWYAELIRNQTDISSFRQQLAFGRRFCAAA